MRKKETNAGKATKTSEKVASDKNLEKKVQNFKKSEKTNLRGRQKLLKDKLCNLKCKKLKYNCEERSMDNFR